MVRGPPSHLPTERFQRVPQAVTPQPLGLLAASAPRHVDHNRPVLDRLREIADRRDRLRAEHLEGAGLVLLSDSSDYTLASPVAGVEYPAKLLVLRKKRVGLVDEESGLSLF